MIQSIDVRRSALTRNSHFSSRQIIHLPALRNLISLFHKWRAVSRVQPENESGPDETVRAFPIVLMVISQEVLAKISIFAFPIHRNSIHKAGEE